MSILKQTFEHALLQSQIEVQESTFSSLGKDLHDNIGQLLSTAKMLLGITQRSISNPPDTLTTAMETIGKAIHEVRSISKTLSKEWLEQFNLIENLTTEVSRINIANNIKLHLLYTHELSLKAEEQIILFRIIQEGIQNAVKHAVALNIHIEITLLQQHLAVTISDDGTGFEPDNVHNGIGILNMKQRTALLGGSIEWNSSKQGCKVAINIPVKPEVS